MGSLIALWVVWLALTPAPDRVEALKRTAPQYLSTRAATDHLQAATLAGVAYCVRPSLLLSIAWHESRYAIATVTPERGRRASCGVMTPTPIARCGAPTLLGGYVAGAAHLREWLTACRGGVTCALRGYAGGYALMRACEAGPVRRGAVDLCDVRVMFLARADWIDRAEQMGQ